MLTKTLGTILLLALIQYSSPFSIPNPLSAPRNIVVLSHDVNEDVLLGLFDDRNLLHSRIDVLSRCIMSSFFVSNNLRSATNLYIMLFPRDSINKDKCITVEVCGHTVRELNPDERTCALCLQRTLLQHAGVKAAERAVARTNENKYIPPAVPNSAKPGQIPKSERNAQRTERKARENMIRRIGEGRNRQN